MIEGLHFDFTADQLRVHLSVKISHHNDRAKFYTESADRLAKGDPGVNDPKPPDFSNRTRGVADPVESLRASATGHRNRAELLAIYRDHLVEETYRLSESDIVTLELISGRF